MAVVAQARQVVGRVFGLVGDRPGQRAVAVNHRIRSLGDAHGLDGLDFHCAPARPEHPIGSEARRIKRFPLVDAVHRDRNEIAFEAADVETIVIEAVSGVVHLHPGDIAHRVFDRVGHLPLQTVSVQKAGAHIEFAGVAAYHRLFQTGVAPGVGAGGDRQQDQRQYQSSVFHGGSSCQSSIKSVRMRRIRICQTSKVPACPAPLVSGPGRDPAL